MAAADVTKSGGSARANGLTRGVTPILFLGFAVASLGGPLALPTLYPGAAGDAAHAPVLVIVGALALFAAPLGIWLAFASRVETPGGLTGFVASVAGRRAAVAHGWLWAFSYFLYLPYTVTDVVYDLLPTFAPGVAPERGALELLLPAALVVLVLAPLRPLLAGLAVLAVGQLALLVALAALELRHVHPAATAGAPAGDALRGAAGVALLFVCGSLPLYLASETRGGSRIVRRGLLGAFALVGGAFLLVGVPLGAAGAGVLGAEAPGVAAARQGGGAGFALAVGLGTAASMLALIVAEYLALARLLHWLHGIRLRSTLVWVGVAFVGADALSLIDPQGFYDQLLEPSLVALFASQLVVFALFPLRWRTPLALLASAAASALAIWGLLTVVAPQLAG